MNVNADIDARIPHVLGKDEIGVPVETGIGMITELGGVYATSVDYEEADDFGDGVVRIPTGSGAAPYEEADDEWDEVPIASS